MAFSRDGKTLATCGESFDDVAEYLDHGHGIIERLFERPTGPGGLKLWDVKTGTLKEDLAARSQTYAVAFSPDGRWLASGGDWVNLDNWQGGTILWNLETSKPVRKVISTAANGSALWAIAFSPDSKLLAIGTQHFDKDKEGSTGGVRLVHAATGIMDWSATVPGFAKPVAFSPDGKTVVVLCGGQSVRFWTRRPGR